MKTCLLKTTKARTGGSIYEHHIFNVLHDIVKIEKWELDTSKPHILLTPKIRTLIKTLVVNPKKDILITNAKGLNSVSSVKKFKKRIIIIHHIDNNNTDKIYYSLINKLLLKRLDTFNYIVTVSDYWTNYLSPYVSQKSKIKLIRNSFNVNKINTICTQNNKEYFLKKYNLPKNKLLVYGGNATKAKGIEELLKLLNSKKYHIITSGIKDGNYPTQHLNLDYEDYLKLLNSVDITILLSKLQEGWNRIAHESVLCKTPVIGTNSAGLGELIKVSNQYILKDPNNIYELIDLAIHNDKNIENGYNYLSQFDEQYFFKKWSDLIMVC